MKRALPLLIAATLSFPAFAQNENAQVSERMDRIEHDLMLMQRQMARGEPLPAGAVGDVGPAPEGTASLEVRLAAIEEQLRGLRGQAEQNDFQIKKLAENVDKMQKDTDFRFGELAAAKPVAAGPAISPEKPAVVKPETPNEKPGERKPLPGPTTAGDGVLKLPEPGGSKPGEFANPREHYNYAFRLLNQTQYEEAASAFDSFTKKYPKDPLVGNAYYWEGETYYIRRDYVNAADYFRQGFEALPEGPKAADNLLKLAMSLDALNRDKEACVVLGQIVTKFKKSSTSVTDRADQEQKRIGCK